MHKGKITRADNISQQTQTELREHTDGEEKIL